MIAPKYRSRTAQVLDQLEVPVADWGDALICLDVDELVRRFASEPGSSNQLVLPPEAEIQTTPTASLRAVPIGFEEDSPRVLIEISPPSIDVEALDRLCSLSDDHLSPTGLFLHALHKGLQHRRYRPAWAMHTHPGQVQNHAAPARIVGGAEPKLVQRISIDPTTIFYVCFINHLRDRLLSAPPELLSVAWEGLRSSSTSKATDKDRAVAIAEEVQDAVLPDFQRAIPPLDPATGELDWNQLSDSPAFVFITGWLVRLVEHGPLSLEVEVSIPVVIELGDEPQTTEAVYSQFHKDVMSALDAGRRELYARFSLEDTGDSTLFADVFVEGAIDQILAPHWNGEGLAAVVQANTRGSVLGLDGAFVVEPICDEGLEPYRCNPGDPQ